MRPTKTAKTPLLGKVGEVQRVNFPAKKCDAGLL